MYECEVIVTCTNVRFLLHIRKAGGVWRIITPQGHMKQIPFVVCHSLTYIFMHFEFMGLGIVAEIHKM